MHIETRSIDLEDHTRSSPLADFGPNGGDQGLDVSEHNAAWRGSPEDHLKGAQVSGSHSPMLALDDITNKCQDTNHSYYHLPRIKLAYQSAGHDVLTVPSGSSLFPLLPFIVAREVPAFWVYFLRAAIG